MGKDYVPSKDSIFDQWFKNLVQYVIRMCTAVPPATTPEWTHIPQAELTKLADAYSAWYTVYVIVLKPHSPAETLAKNEARDEAEGVIRPFVNKYLRYDPVTDAQRRDMGIPVRGGSSPVPPPATVPELIPDTGARRRVAVHYRDEGSDHRGKPAHVSGIEVRWAIMDRPPANIEKELIHSSFDTRSPLNLDFEEEDRGKHLYMAGRWEIHREGTKGLFGAVVDAFIP
jgi:hypothetical protein